MRISTLVALVGAPLLAVASPAPDALPAAANNHGSQWTCYTHYGTKSVKNIKTLRETKTTPCTRTTTNTNYVTITPRALTVNRWTKITSTSTAPSTVLTSVVTSITTSSTTTTLTNTITADASTATTVTTASTVPAPSQFIPIQSSLPGSSLSQENTGPNPVTKRSLAKRALEVRDNEVPNGGRQKVATLVDPAKKNDDGKIVRRSQPLKAYGNKKSYKQSVNCYTYVKAKQCAIKKKTVTKTKTAPRPVTTTTRTLTVTQTVVPSATTTTTTTVASTTTITSLTSTTSTTTTTNTFFSFTTTVYAACATANAADLVDSHFIVNTEGKGEGEYNNVDSVDALTSAYDCCVSANLYQAAVAQSYFWFPDTNTCFIATAAGQCPATGFKQTVIFDNDGPAAVVGNVNCGIFDSSRPS